ncbi:M23 family metallopeptidase [Dyella silvatica]|uniref:M23 family metallopeptidase n=1 Tax=Dyella silvatica TaxID=2992128 RepID=UPI00224D53D6|nr:M23 family metallopeptidase [Dyella silvatica]
MANVSTAQRVPQHQSFGLQVPWQAEPVIVDGKALLVYELHLTNFARDPLLLKRISVVDSHGQALIELQGDALSASIDRGDGITGNDKLRLPAGSHATAYLSVPLTDSSGAELQLRHLVTYQTSATATSEPASVEGGAFEVNHRPPLQLGPPLRGGPWAAIYDPRWERGHRRVLYAINGAVHIPGRFAIDWIRLGSNGGFARGDGAKPAQWYGYGADVLAVADTMVASTGEGIAEPSTVSSTTPRKVALEDAAGNFVALDLGQGRYAFYEHLKPGSITVKPGERVKRGQVIGKLGFSGESTGPHLHFHISDANAPLDAEGLPYGFERFRVVGVYTSIEAFDRGERWLPSSARQDDIRKQEFPAPLSVVDFPADASRH